MSAMIAYVVIGILVVVVAFLIIYYILGGRLKRAKLGASVKEGIYGEFEMFEISTSPVKIHGRSAPIEPEPQPQPLPSAPIEPEPQPQPLPSAPTQPSSKPTPIVARELEGKPKFMSDEYIVNIAMRLQMDSEEGDRVRFIDHTIK